MTLSEAEKSKRLNRPCKHCGNPVDVLDSRQAYCSKQCGFDARSMGKITGNCCICGAEVVKYKSVVAGRESRMCCGDDCQRKLAARVGWSRKFNKSWVLPTLIVCSCGDVHKGKYCSKQIKLRAAIAQELRKLHSQLQHLESKNTWQYAVAYRLQGFRWRKSSKVQSWKGGNACQALANLCNKIQWFERSEWYKKIANKLSNQRKRERRKREKASDSRRSHGEARSPAVQVCFDWMES